MATCSVRITDHPPCANGIAVSLTDEGQNVVVLIDGNQLDDDPRGVMAELFNHLNRAAQDYEIRVVTAA